ncbi:hypothetical protein BJ508DRAFT_170682 [Ascobolus immersus RN42]|uniref:NB-ARC domain-containing protein n=1 Tax=Ascobolus immersus RN42 TaxID=1160509 RepID=A0A3N4HY87_ASCIM|nr:hypothetical protein BJ508DRAFT_170682 [Ascobolus immersus RN42]
MAMVPWTTIISVRLVGRNSTPILSVLCYWTTRTSCTNLFFLQRELQKYGEKSSIRQLRPKCWPYLKNSYMRVIDVGSQMLDFLENTAAGDEEVSAHERLPMFKNVLLGSEALIRLSSISAENSTFKVPDENVEFRQEAFKFGPSVRESNPTNSNAYLDTYSSQTPTPILSASHSAPPKIELRQSCTGLTPRLTPLSFSDAYFPVRYPPNPGYDDENTYHSPTPERVITNLDFFFDCAPRHHVPRWELMTKLLQRVETRKVCMLVGPPASGKTQLALRFAKETEYSAVFWINGSSLVELCTSYLRIAQMLGIGPLRDPFQREDRLTRRNERDYIIAVKRWLNQRRGKYLLVFDGCEDAKVLEDLELYFPTQREHAHILVTTRTHCIRLTNDDASVNGTERLEVGGLKKDEAMELLFRGANADLAERDLSCAREVIRIVQGHALAVDLIGDYIHQRV